MAKGMPPQFAKSKGKGKPPPFGKKDAPSVATPAPPPMMMRRGGKARGK